MGSPLFLDADLQRQLDEEGFVVVSLLDETEIDRLRKFYDDLDRGDVPTRPFHYSMDHPDEGFVSRVIGELTEVVGGALKPLLHDMQVVTASYVVKECDPRSVVPPHVDWTFVEEPAFQSVTVWTPLMDVDIDNGAVGVIHGSHRFFPDQVRASPSPQCKAVISDHMLTLFPFLDIQPLHAGQALIMNNATIHGSLPNMTDQRRVATGLVVAPVEAGLRHHYLLPNTDPPLLETYEVDRGFFTRYGNDALSGLFDAGGRPEGKGVSVSGQQPYERAEVSQQDLLAMVQSHPGNKFDPELVRKAQAAFAGLGFPMPQEPAGEPAPDPSAVETAEESEGVGRFYDEHHDAFVQVYGQVIQAFRTKDVKDLLDHQIEAMGLADGQRVLDAGCGVAGPAIHFAQRRDIEIEALSISATQVEAARERVAEAGLSDRVNVNRGDYHTIGELFPADHFDVVYFLESFGHSHDKRRLLEAGLRVLKPGGTLYVKDLFLKEPQRPEHVEPMRREVEKINVAYHYEIADLYEVLRDVRELGFILASLNTIDLELEKFENLTISNDFQELTGIACIEDWATYIFPVEFYEMKCIKPWYAMGSGDSRYFLQNLYHMQVLGTQQKDL